MRIILLMICALCLLGGCGDAQTRRDEHERRMQQDRLDHKERVAIGHGKHLYDMAKLGYEHAQEMAKDAAEAARVWWDKVFKLLDEWIMPLIAGAGFLGATYLYLMLLARTVKEMQEVAISARLEFNKQKHRHELEILSSMKPDERETYAKNKALFLPSPKTMSG